MSNHGGVFLSEYAGSKISQLFYRSAGYSHAMFTLELDAMQRLDDARYRAALCRVAFRYERALTLGWPV